MELLWSSGPVLGAVSEEVFAVLFAKVTKFIGMTCFPTIPCYQLMQRFACINVAVALVVIGLDFSYREVN